MKPLGLLLLSASLATQFAYADLDDRFHSADAFQGDDFQIYYNRKPLGDSAPKSFDGGQDLFSFHIMSSPPPKPYKAGWTNVFTALPKFGYESNPLQSQSTQDAGFFALDVKDTLTYVFENQRDKLSGQYKLESIYYQGGRAVSGKEPSSANSLANKLTLGWSELSEDRHWQYGVDAVGAHVMNGGRAFSESLGARPAVIYGWGSNWIGTGVSYLFSRAEDLSRPAVPANNDSAYDHTPRIETTVLLGKCPWPWLTNLWLSDVTIGYQHKWHESAGSLRAYGDHTVDLDLNGNLFGSENATFEILYSHGWRDFSALGSAAPNVVRHDQIHDVTLRTSWKVHEADKGRDHQKLTVNLVAQYQYRSKGSNKATSVFDDHAVLLGLQFGL